MTREQQREIKAAKIAYRNACRLEKKTEKQEKRSWDKMVEMLEKKGAWMPNELKTN